MTLLKKERGEVLERGRSPSFFPLPLMLRIHLPIMERGIKGVRLITNLPEGFN